MSRMLLVPMELAELIDSAFLPLNPNKMRTAAPRVVEAVRAFKRLVYAGPLQESLATVVSVSMVDGKYHWVVDTTLDSGAGNRGHGVADTLADAQAAAGAYLLAASRAGSAGAAVQR